LKFGVMRAQITLAVQHLVETVVRLVIFNHKQLRVTF
jgi:hypothetical protein